MPLRFMKIWRYQIYWHFIAWNQNLFQFTLHRKFGLFSRKFVQSFAKSSQEQNWPYSDTFHFFAENLFIGTPCRDMAWFIITTRVWLITYYCHRVRSNENNGKRTRFEKEIHNFLTRATKTQIHKPASFSKKPGVWHTPKMKSISVQKRHISLLTADV